MKFLIIGASGLVGGNCFKHFHKQPTTKVVGTHLSYPSTNTQYFNTLKINDVKNFNVINYQPNIIVHCGALTHVDYCEENPQESFQKNVVATKNIVDLCKKTDAHLVFISSDYVFDGQNGPYTETDRTNPISVYGKHKLEAENWVAKSLKKHTIIRITNVYGNEERNKNFIARLVVGQNKLKSQTLKTAIDQFATPVNAMDVARAVFLLCKDGKTGIYHIASTDYVNRHQLAERTLQYLKSKNIELQPVLTKLLNQPAKRPLQGGLKCVKFLKEYPDFTFTNVDDYLRQRQKL